MLTRMLAALAALLLTVGFQVWVVPQALAEGTPLELGGVVELAWGALVGLTLLLAVRAAVGLLPRRRA
jgi:hypothetical protein